MTRLHHIVATCLALACASASAAGEWDYKKQGSDWAGQFPQFCAGDRQSPVDLSTQTSQQEPLIKAYVFSQAVNGSNFTMTLKNDGHKVELSWTPELQIKMGLSSDQLMYTAAQLHWHWGGDSHKGSEHTLNKATYPAEGHLVFYNSKDYASLSDAVNKPNGLAVLGVFNEVSQQDNPLLSKLDGALRNDTLVTASGTAKMSFTKDALNLFDAFLPSDRAAFFRYDGSLTTPSCYETVLWTVYRQAVSVSEAQLQLLRRLKYTDGSAMVNNYRPPLLLNPGSRPGTPRTLYRTFSAAASPHATAWSGVACALLLALLANAWPAN